MAGMLAESNVTLASPNATRDDAGYDGAVLLGG